MELKLKKGVVLIFTLLISWALAQEKPLINSVKAVVGTELVLLSDLQEIEAMAKAQGAKNEDNCSFLEDILTRKLIVYKAKQDTLIPNREEDMKANADAQYESIKAQVGSEEQVLAVYKFNSVHELKKVIINQFKERYYMEAKTASITQGLDVSPSEVKDFFERKKNFLPDVKEEVVLAHILRHPKLTQEHKNKLIARLKQIKKDIESGEASFEQKADIYSEDLGSASNGGTYLNVRKGQFVKEFEAVAYNLQEGEISEPFESEYGFHIVRLLKHRGQNVDVQHILLKSKADATEIALAKKELDSIRTQIAEGKITFAQAALKHSEDKRTKYNKGLIIAQTQSGRQEKYQLPATLLYHIAGVEDGKMSDVFDEETGEDKKNAVRLVEVVQTVQPHKLSLETDYERIKAMALMEKREQKMNDWVEKEIPNTFILVNGQEDCNFHHNWRKTIKGSR